MPISGEQFEKGLDSTEYQIVEFLKKNPNKAYSLSEIVQGIGVSIQTDDTLKRIVVTAAIVFGYNSILDKLTKNGLIEQKTINGQTFYRAHKNK
jgi:hypothetical protein